MMNKTIFMAVLAVLSLAHTCIATETKKSFTVEVERSLTDDQNREDIRILAMLEAKSTILDMIVTYLWTETSLGEVNVSDETKRKSAYIITHSRDTTEHWSEDKFHLEYTTTVELGYLNLFAKQLNKPKFGSEHGWILTEFKRIGQDLSNEYNKPEVNKEKTKDLRTQYYVYDCMEISKYSEGYEKVEVLTRAIELNSDRGQLYRWRASAYNTNKEYDLALQDCYKALEIDPYDAAGYMLRAGIYHKLSLHEKALADYTRCFKLTPDDAKPYRCSALIYKEMGDSDNAILYYDKAIAIDPEDNYSYYSKGYIYYDRGDLELALECFNNAVKIAPDDEKNYSSRGYVYMRQQKYDLAIIEFTKAINLNTDRGLHYMNRGNAYLLNDEPEKAKPDLEKAVELGETRAKELLRQLPLTE